MDIERPALTSPLRQSHGHLCILLLVTIAVYAPTLFYPFFLDDYVYLETANNLDWQGAANLFRAATLDQTASSVWWAPSGVLPFYRPVGQLSFAGDHFFWGLQPFGYHLTNLLLHLVCTLLTWRLARRLFEEPRYALAAAVVFALHPIHNEAVAWISGRFDLLVCVCAAASLLAYLNWKDRPTTGWAWGGLCVAWFILGLGCKETALILPAMIVAVELLHPSAYPSQRRRHALPVLTAMAIVASLYLLLRTALFGTPIGRLPPPYGLDTSSPLVAIRSLAENCAMYLFDMVLGISVEPTYMSQFWRDHAVLFAAVSVLCGLVVIAAVIVGRSRAFLIGAIWLGLFTAPSLMSMPGERNVYLASVGLALMVAAVLRGAETRWSPASTAEPQAPRKHRLRRATIAIVGLWIIVCLVEQGLMGCLSAASERVHRDLTALLPDPPPNAHIYVVNQNPSNSVGFAQAIRLRYGRPDLSGRALSLAPAMRAFTTDRVSVLGPDSIRITREGGDFFSSFFERFHRFSEPASELPDACRRAGLELLNPPESYNDLRVLELRFPHPLDDPRIRLFYWDNQRIQRKLDVPWMGSLARLRELALTPGPGDTRR